MKTVVVTLFSMVLAPITSFACGMGSNAFVGDEDLARQATKSSLVCDLNGESTQTELKLYAIYRCINSPVTGVVIANGVEAELASIAQTGEGKIELKVKGDVKPITCQMTPQK